MGSVQLKTVQIMIPGYTLLNLNYPLTAYLQTWTRKGSFISNNRTQLIY